MFKLIFSKKKKKKKIVDFRLLAFFKKTLKGIVKKSPDNRKQQLATFTEYHARAMKLPLYASIVVCRNLKIEANL